MKLIGFLAASFLVGLTSAQSGNPTVYYVGNMGVAIVKNDSVILIDALHDYYEKYYLPTDTAILKKLSDQEHPFLKLIAITATHMHNDHFDETLISQMNQKIRQSKVVMGKQPAARLTGVDPTALHIINQAGTVKLTNQLEITMKNIGHSGNRHQAIENYRIEIRWGKYRFVHFGDSPSGEKSLDGLEPGADVAVVPYWHCYAERDIQLLEAKKFKTIIAAHIDPSDNTPFGKFRVALIPFRTYGQRYILE